MDPNTIALLAIAGAQIAGFGGMVATIYSTTSGTNKRIDDLKSDMDHRFARTDQKIDDLRSDTDRRFEETNQRMDDLKSDMIRRFAEMKTDNDGRFSDLKVDLRDVRGRVDYIADSLSLGRAKLRES